MIDENLPTNVFTLRQSEFRAIPGGPWVYWFDDSIIKMFTANQSLSEKAFGKHGLSTCNNFRYIRFWWEVAKNNIDWNDNWNKKTTIIWNNIPSDIVDMMKKYSLECMNNCLVRKPKNKHKYAYVIKKN